MATGFPTRCITPVHFRISHSYSATIVIARLRVTRDDCAPSRFGIRAHELGTNPDEASVCVTLFLSMVCHFTPNRYK